MRYLLRFRCYLEISGACRPPRFGESYIRGYDFASSCAVRRWTNGYGIGHGGAPLIAASALDGSRLDLRRGRSRICEESRGWRPCWSKAFRTGNDQASDPKVKAFATQMVKDHTHANNELKPIADLNKIPWPSRLEGESEATYNRLPQIIRCEIRRGIRRSHGQRSR